MLPTLPTRHGLQESVKVMSGQVHKIIWMFKVQIHSTDLGEGQDVQSANAHFTEQRIVLTKITIKN